MPLVVPGITSKTGDKTEEWTNKLVGKKLHDETSSETVCTHREDITLYRSNSITALQQERSSQGLASHRPRTDGHQGL